MIESFKSLQSNKKDNVRKLSSELVFYVECHTISPHKLKQFSHTKSFSVKKISEIGVQPSEIFLMRLSF